MGKFEESLTSLNASCCFISCPRWKLAVVCLYRSPSICVSVGLGDLCQLLSKLSLCSRHIVLAGDLNINLMNDCSATANYQNILSDFQLTQFVPGPSRVTDLSSTLIDHILCTSSISVLDVKQAIGLSDHRVQILDLDIMVQRPPNSFCWVRPFRKCSWSSVGDCLSSAPWSVMEMYDDPDDMWGVFIHIITSCLDKYAPLQKVLCKHSRRHTPWLSPEILSAIHEKQKAKRTAEKSGKDDDVAHYKRLKNALKTTIRSAKLNCLNTLLQQSQKLPHLAAKVWSQVNDIICRHQKSVSSSVDAELSPDNINDFFVMLLYLVITSLLVLSALTILWPQMFIFNLLIFLWMRFCSGCSVWMLKRPLDLIVSLHSF